jgi:thiol-disulfide isomerase/thioredoxin
MSKKKQLSRRLRSPVAPIRTVTTRDNSTRGVGQSPKSTEFRSDVKTKRAPATGSRRRTAGKLTRLRRRRIRIGLFTVATIVVLTGVASIIVQSGRSRAGYNATPTAWVLPRLSQSGKVALSDLRGKPVVVNMFASWCTVCQSELPAFTAEARRLRGKITFVEVNSLETGNGLVMAQQYGLAAAGVIVLSDVGGAQHSGLHDALGGGNNMPVSAFYSASGKLITSHVGGFSASSLQIQLRQLYGVSA